MIQITAHMRIMVAAHPVDFRKGIDSLCALVRQRLESDPFSGTLFVFINKSRTALRVLCYDGQGYWLCHKRLSCGRFRWVFRGDKVDLSARDLQALVWNAYPFGEGGDFRSIEKRLFEVKKVLATF